jgi:hypothetical protein
MRWWAPPFNELGDQFLASLRIEFTERQRGVRFLFCSDRVSQRQWRCNPPQAFNPVAAFRGGTTPPLELGYPGGHSLIQDNSFDRADPLKALPTDNGPRFPAAYRF